MLRSLAIACLFVCPVVADEATGDLKKLIGVWQPTLYMIDGQKKDEKSLQNIKLTITGLGENELVQGDQTFHATYKLDESTSPKTIDLTRTRGADKGKKRLGIYELKGETFRLCVGPVGGSRPKTFASEPGSGIWLEVWKRVK